MIWPSSAALVISPPRTDADRMRLDNAITWFLDGWSSEGPRVPTRETIRDYTSSLKWFASFASSMDRAFVDQVDADLLRAAVKVLMTEGPNRSPLFKGGEGSARTLGSSVARLLAWLRAQGLETANLDHVKIPRPPERIQPRLTPDEFRRLETAVTRQMVEPTRTNPRVTVARDLALLYLLADAGLRASEVGSMRVGDIDFEIGRITVRQGKGRKPRGLSILDPSDPRGGQTLTLLREWVRVRDTIRAASEHDFLWVSLHGRPLDREGLRRILKRLCEDASLDSNRPPHAFRRATFTERYRANPEQIKVLSARMGWSPKSHHMVNVYTRGAELEFAAEVTVPSVAALWHSGNPNAALGGNGFHRPRREPTRQSRRSRAASRDDDLASRLAAAAAANPDLARVLLQALQGPHP